jgi:hypothetical protein
VHESFIQIFGMVSIHFSKRKKKSQKNCKLLPNLILIITMVWNSQAHSMFFFPPNFCDVAQLVIIHKHIVLLGMMSSKAHLLGWARWGTLWAGVRPFRNIRSGMTYSNNFENTFHVQRHFGHYYECMIINGRLCHIMSSRQWHNLPPKTLILDL